MSQEFVVASSPYGDLETAPVSKQLAAASVEHKLAHTVSTSSPDDLRAGSASHVQSYINTHYNVLVLLAHARLRLLQMCHQVHMSPIKRHQAAVRNHSPSNTGGQRRRATVGVHQGPPDEGRAHWHLGRRVPGVHCPRHRHQSEAVEGELSSVESAVIMHDRDA